jgi:outer membrane protein assembly factor BamD (BamD/ComL family)
MQTVTKCYERREVYLAVVRRVSAVWRSRKDAKKERKSRSDLSKDVRSYSS